VNLELPFEPTDGELDDVLADLDKALDADFLRDIDEALERIAGQGKLDDLRAPALAAS
jgi:hypothetical protein